MYSLPLTTRHERPVTNASLSILTPTDMPPELIEGNGFPSINSDATESNVRTSSRFNQLVGSQPQIGIYVNILLRSSHS